MDATQNKSNLNPFSTFLIIGTAWAFDALDVGLLSFVMPLIRKEWLLTQSPNGPGEFCQFNRNDCWRLFIRSLG